MKKVLFFMLLLVIGFGAMAQQRTRSSEPQWTSVISHSPETFQVQLISSTENSVKVNVKVPGFYTKTVTTPQGKAFVITVPKSVSTAQAGEPDMPMTGIPVMIGDKANMNVRVIDAQYIDYENMEVAPSKGDFPRSIDPATVPYTYGECYSQDAFFPASNVGLYEPYIIRDFRGQNIVIYPFAYNPVTKTLRVYYNMTVEMYKVDDHGTNVIATRHRGAVKLDPDFKSVYQRHFINYEESSTRYTPVDEEGDLLIICYDNFISSMTDFVNWKKTRGVNTTIVGTSTAGSTYSAIKTYIQNQYNANNNLTHVLLVGDVAQIPGYSYSGGGSSYSGLGDNAYGQIVGSDIYNDVFIGRFSATSTAHVATQVQKVITYERDLTTSATWCQNGMGVSTSEGSGGHNNEDDYQHIDNIRTDLINYGYSTVYQEYYNVSGYSSTTQQISTRINSGVGIITYCNHGSETAWQSHSPYYSTSYVNALTNNNKLPFIFSVACLNGKYDHSSDCFAEAWMRATNNNEPAGAVGTMMSYISQPWIPPMWAEDEFVDILTGQYSSNVKHTWGGTAINGLFGIFDHYGTSESAAVGTYQAWILYGDPSLMLRTKTPQAMTVTHNGNITIGISTYTVNVSNGNGAVATITDANHINVSKATVSNGTATISLNTTNLTAGSELTLCVFGFNKVTYVGTINVVGGTQYNLTVNQPQHGTIGAPAQAYANATVTLTATPETGYCLSAWDVRDASNNSINVTNNQFTMPESDVTVTAIFVQGLQVTLAPVTHGSISADPLYALQGTTINLTATPAEGFEFGSWVVCKTGDPNTTVTVNGNSFTMPNYSVTVSATFEFVTEQTVCEDFESYSGTAYNVAGSLPTGWNVIFTGSNSAYSPHVATAIYGNAVISNGNGFCFTSGSSTYGTNNYAILPTYEGTLESISFDYRYESTSYGTLSLGYVTNASNANTFVSLQTVPASTTQGTHVTYSLTNSNIPENARLAFKWNHTSSYYTCGIDNVCVTTQMPLPPCDAVTAITVEATQSSAVLTITGGSGLYNIETKEGNANWVSVASNVSGQSYTLTNLSENTAYQVRVQSVCDLNVSDWTTVSFSTPIGCPAPTALNCTALTGTSATLSWTEEGEAGEWLLQYGTNNGFAADTYTEMNVTGTPVKELVNLTAETQYYARVKAICGADDESEWSNTCSFFPTYFLVIGSGTGTNSNLPTNVSNKYSLTQQIYTVSELGDAGNIVSVGFRKNNSEECARNIDIYMVSTDKSSFTGTTDWIPVTDANKVYSGTVNFADNDWTTITLDRPFSYDGTNNIAIMVDDNSGRTVSATPFLAFPAGNQALRICGRTTNYKATTGSYTGTLESSKNQIRIMKVDYALICDAPADLTVSEIDHQGATVNWNGEADSWIVAYRPANAELFTEVNVNTTSYTLTGLDALTNYTVKVAAKCGNETVWGEDVNFTTLSTPCPVIVLDNNGTYTENFDNYTPSTTAATGVEPDCWEVINEDVALTEATMPQVYYNAAFATSGSYTLRMKNRCVYAMPALSENIDLTALTMTFNLRQPKTVYRLQVGVINAEGEFEKVKEINNSGVEMEEVTVDFSGYNGNGHRIAFRNSVSKSSTLEYSINYIDDIVLSYNTLSCGMTLPYTENFDQITILTVAETGAQPDCWEVFTEDVALNDITKPQAYYNASYATSGSYTLRMKNRCTYAMPALSPNVPVSDLTMTFNLRQPNSKYRLQVGVLNDEGEFTLVKTFKCSGTSMQSFTVDFSNYTGTGHRIAFRNTLVPGTGMSTTYLDYSVNYIDDINIGYTEVGKSVANNDAVLGENADLDVEVYPNPTKDVVNVQCTMNNVQCTGIEIVDVYGKIITTVNQPQTQINVSGLAAGMYFVRVTTDRGVVTKPFVKR